MDAGEPVGEEDARLSQLTAAALGSAFSEENVTTFGVSHQWLNPDLKIGVTVLSDKWVIGK